jgi:hypothetical protein
MMPRKTNHKPHIFYAHSEEDYQHGKERNCPGLSAGYLNVKKMPEDRKDIWETVFNLEWENVCYSLAIQLAELGVDSFTIVPCSRADVVAGIKNGFLKAGLSEVPDVILKKGSEVSYAGKDPDFITNNTEIDFKRFQNNTIKKLAVCDDYSESGKTLRGLYDAINSYNGTISPPEVVLCSIGISKTLVKENE